jgi:ribokinase
LNPAPAQELPEELVSLTDYLVPNETELSLLTNHTVNDISSAEKAAKTLLDRGVQNIIVTLGKNGALIVTDKQVSHVEAFKVDVVDTTAAGDAFIGGFATKFMESASLLVNPQEQALALQNAVRYGCATGALAATKFGAQPSLPTKEEVEKLVGAQQNR